MKRLILTQNAEISIVAQDKRFGDAENFTKSRADEVTLAQIGAAGNTYSVDIVAKYMPDPSLEIGAKRIFTIISNDDGRYLGDVRIVRNEEFNAYELGIVILEEERNKTFGTQALSLASEYIFNILGADKVVIRVYQNNPRAKALYERLGYKYIKTVDDGYTVSGTPVLEDWLVLS